MHCTANSSACHATETNLQDISLTPTACFYRLHWLHMYRCLPCKMRFQAVCRPGKKSLVNCILILSPFATLCERQVQSGQAQVWAVSGSGQAQVWALWASSYCSCCSCGGWRHFLLASCACRLGTVGWMGSQSMGLCQEPLSMGTLAWTLMSTAKAMWPGTSWPCLSRYLMLI